MSSPADVPKRDRWAQLRFAIIGPLLAAPPEPGDLQGALARLAAKIWRHPINGTGVRFGMSTIERWFYAARRRGDPIPALRNRARPRGRFASLSQALRDVLIAQYREHPGWTVQLHYDNLRVALAGPDQPSLPSYPTVRRFFRAQGMFRQRPARRRTDGALIAIERLEQREVRSFEVDHVGALWHFDFHQCSRQVLTPDGTVSLVGQRFEIASRYHHLQTIHLRYARWDLSRVDLVDPHTDTILCPVRPLDRSANASGQRRLREAPAIELSHVPPTTMAPLLKQLLAEYSATGLPPAYLHDPHTLNGQDDTP